MKKQIITFGIIIILLIVGFIVYTEVNKNPLEGLNYINEEYGFGFNPPEYRYSKEGNQSSENIIAFYLNESGGLLVINKPKYFEENETIYDIGNNKINNLGFNYFNLENDGTYSYTFNISINNRDGTYTTITATANQTINELIGKNKTINGLPSYEIFFDYKETYNVSGLETTYNYKKWFLIEKDNMYFELFFDATYNEYNEDKLAYIEFVDDIANSFKFI